MKNLFADLACDWFAGVKMSMPVLFMAVAMIASPFTLEEVIAIMGDKLLIQIICNI